MISAGLAGITCASMAIAAPGRQLDTQPIQTVDLPPGNNGDGMVYLDRETAPEAKRADKVLDAITAGGEADDLLRPMSPVYTALRRGLGHYRARWGHLPQVEIPAGPAMKGGEDSKRVELVRQRLGLAAGTKFDKDVTAAVRAFKADHALSADGVVDAETVAALNRGSQHYERVIAVNMERARALPAGGGQRYILVDAGAARLWLYENGKVRDTMRAIVGSKAQETPMIAALMRYAEVNPYWNIPPDLVQERIAPRVLNEGTAYLASKRYQVLSDWSDQAQVVDPATVDWKAVAEKRETPRVRQLPGADNSMGEIKFMMPNDMGIYLHDTPGKALFEQADRWISNGCVRVEDARRLAAWLFGEMPQGKSPDQEERVDLSDPVPVYITYLTAAPAEGDGGIVFRADPYGRDAEALARLSAQASGAAALE